MVAQSAFESSVPVGGAVSVCSFLFRACWVTWRSCWVCCDRIWCPFWMSGYRQSACTCGRLSGALLCFRLTRCACICANRYLAIVMVFASVTYLVRHVAAGSCRSVIGCMSRWVTVCACCVGACACNLDLVDQGMAFVASQHDLVCVAFCVWCGALCWLLHVARCWRSAWFRWEQ